MLTKLPRSASYTPARAVLTFSVDQKNHRWSGSNAFTTPTLVTNTARPHSKINSFLSFPSRIDAHHLALMPIEIEDCGEFWSGSLVPTAFGTAQLCLGR